MQNKKRNVIISLSLILMLLVAVGSFKASANEVNLKSEIKDFSLVNSGTGYTNKKTTSFFQEENGFDANVIDKEDNNVVATGDLLTYNVTATIANGLKRQVDFSFVIPKELQLNAGTNNDVDKYAKAFCGADDPYDNLVEYGPREATYTNNVLKCSYFVKSSVSFNIVANNNDG